MSNVVVIISVVVVLVLDVVMSVVLIAAVVVVVEVLLLVVIEVPTGVVRALVCTEATIGGLNIVSNVAVDLLTDGLTDILLLALANNIAVEILVDVNMNVFGGAMTAFEFVMPGPLEAFCC